MTNFIYLTITVSIFAQFLKVKEIESLSSEKYPFNCIFPIKEYLYKLFQIALHSLHLK